MVWAFLNSKPFFGGLLNLGFVHQYADMFSFHFCFFFLFLGDITFSVAYFES